MFCLWYVLSLLNAVPPVSTLHRTTCATCCFAQVLGKGDASQRAGTLATVLDGYFAQGGHHINVNVLNREMLMDAVQVGVQ